MGTRPEGAAKPIRTYRSGDDASRLGTRAERTAISAYFYKSNTPMSCSAPVDIVKRRHPGVKTLPDEPERQRQESRGGRQAYKARGFTVRHTGTERHNRVPPIVTKLAQTKAVSWTFTAPARRYGHVYRELAVQVGRLSKSSGPARAGVKVGGDAWSVYMERGVFGAPRGPRPSAAKRGRVKT